MLEEKDETLKAETLKELRAFSSLIPAFRTFSSQLFLLVLTTMLVKIANSSLVSRSSVSIISPWMSQFSCSNSNHSCDSSASWSRPSSFEQNSASERARDASRVCDATDVPDRNNCLPNTATSPPTLGNPT